MCDNDQGTGHVLFNQARDAVDRGDIENAIRLFQASLLLEPHYKTALLLGECLVRKERWLDAVVPLAASTTLNNQAIAPTLLAEVMLKLDEPWQALRFVRMGLDRNPNYGRAKALLPFAEEADRKRIAEICGDDSNDPLHPDHEE